MFYITNKNFELDKFKEKLNLIIGEIYGGNLAKACRENSLPSTTLHGFRKRDKATIGTIFKVAKAFDFNLKEYMVKDFEFPFELYSTDLLDSVDELPKNINHTMYKNLYYNKFGNSNESSLPHDSLPEDITNTVKCIKQVTGLNDRQILKWALDNFVKTLT